MDRALLERMVGAAVLVLIFVVFAPMLLDGREDASTGREDDAAPSTRTKVIVLNKPEQVADKPVESATIKPEPAKPANKPAVNNAARTKPSAEAPEQGFAVQLGSFSSRDNAVAFAGSLGDAGYKVFVIRGSASSGAVYRVYAGPEATRTAAEKLAGRLAREGQSVMIVDLAGRSGG